MNIDWAYLIAWVVLGALVLVQLAILAAFLLAPKRGHPSGCIEPFGKWVLIPSLLFLLVGKDAFVEFVKWIWPDVTMMFLVLSGQAHSCIR